MDPDDPDPTPADQDQNACHDTRVAGIIAAYSAPYVAGIAALMIQADPEITAGRILSILDATSDPNVGN